MAIDAAGRIYVSTFGLGVQVFSPAGNHLGTIPAPREIISLAFSGPEKKTLYAVGMGLKDPYGQEFRTQPGTRNVAETIYKIDVLAQGFKGRAK